VHHPLPNEQDRATDRSHRYTPPIPSSHISRPPTWSLGQSKTALLKQAANQGIAGQVPTIIPHFAFGNLLEILEEVLELLPASSNKSVFVSVSNCRAVGGPLLLQLLLHLHDGVCQRSRRLLCLRHRLA
jgi:hypothetical protein